ncbi:hypothetical protein Lal_00013601 [Lupinus albus]|nr:hypothetical protein Lal_00013601 [Lupinus albus]
MNKKLELIFGFNPLVLVSESPSNLGQAKDPFLSSYLGGLWRTSQAYQTVKSRPDRYVGRCTHYGAGCEWRIRASFNVKRGVWEIRKINGTHT